MIKPTQLIGLAKNSHEEMQKSNQLQFAHSCSHGSFDLKMMMITRRKTFSLSGYFTGYITVHIFFRKVSTLAHTTTPIPTHCLEKGPDFLLSNST